MTLRLMDGFDIFSSNAELFQGGWAGDSNVSVSAGGRRGGRAASCSFDSSKFYKQLPTAYSTLVMGAAMYRTSSSASASAVLGFSDGVPASATVQMAVRVNPDNTLSVYRGLTLLATTSFAINNGWWYYLEFKVVLHASAGSYELRVAGQTLLSASGINTLATANASANYAFLGGPVGHAGGTSVSQLFDDVYVLDGSGTSENDFLGDVRIDTLLPTGSGAYTDFTATSGTHASVVDEVPLNTADYLYSATVGHKEVLAMPALSTLTVSGVKAVQLNVGALTDVAGSRGIATLLRSNTTDVEGPSTLLGTAHSYLRSIQDKNPDGDVAWTKTSVDAASFGAIVKV